MTEDLLNRIRREMQERMAQLRGAVDERDGLQAELRALEAELRAQADRSPVVDMRSQTDLQPVVELRRPAALPLAAAVPHAVVPRAAVLSEPPPPPRLVSPKVIRLMCGRSSFARPVGPRGSKRVNLAREEPVTPGAGEVWRLAG
jgi:hypothetical protein